MMGSQPSISRVFSYIYPKLDPKSFYSKESPLEVDSSIRLANLYKNIPEYLPYSNIPSCSNITVNKTYKPSITSQRQQARTPRIRMHNQRRSNTFITDRRVRSTRVHGRNHHTTTFINHTSLLKAKIVSPAQSKKDTLTSDAIAITVVQLN